MSSTLLEIVALPNGDFVLKRSDSEDAPLVRVGFSKEAQSILGEHEGEIAKVMISAGIQAYAAIAQAAAEKEMTAEELGKTLH